MASEKEAAAGGGGETLALTLGPSFYLVRHSSTASETAPRAEAPGSNAAKLFLFIYFSNPGTPSSLRGHAPSHVLGVRTCRLGARGFLKRNKRVPRPSHHEDRDASPLSA